MEFGTEVFTHEGTGRYFILSMSGRQCLHGLEAELLLLMDGWITCGMKRHKEKHPTKQAQAVWASHQEPECCPVLPVAAGGGRVSTPTSSLLLLCRTWTAAGHPCSIKHGQLPHGCSSAGIGVCGSQNGPAAARAVAFRLMIAGLLYRSTHWHRGKYFRWQRVYRV